MARILDGLILLPVVLLCEVPAVVYLLANIHNFNQGNTGSSLPAQTAFGFEGFAYLGLFAYLGIEVAWEAFATHRWGRTPGKAIFHIRPARVRDDMTGVGPLSRAACWGRAGALVGFSLLSVVGLLDSLWCLWDGERQCLHDKVVKTVVINDR